LAKLSGIQTGAEPSACAGDDDAHNSPVVRGLIHQSTEFCKHSVGKGVQLVRPVECNQRHRIIDLISDVGHGWNRTPSSGRLPGIWAHNAGSHLVVVAAP
jgi:hypothetical protein